MRFSVICIVALGLLILGCRPSSQTETKKTGASAPSSASAGTMDKSAKGDTVTTASGLKYIDIKVGNGAIPATGQNISVHCTGWLTNGQKFYSTKDDNQPLDFVLGIGKVIKGWDEGLASMKVGGMRKLIIPPQLAYGDRGRGSTIPPGSTLIFDVELLGIK
jgi:peptidylprolyl isomerase